MMDILEYVLLAFLIFCAVAATLSRRLLITVIIYMAFSLIMSVIRQIGFIVPVAYLFAVTLGLPAVWFSFPIAEISSILMALFFLKKTYDKQLKDLPE